jgi:type I restriction enzyme R subunit
VAQGEDELDHDKLGGLLALKYYTISDAAEQLGGIAAVQGAFVGFQPRLFE